MSLPYAILTISDAITRYISKGNDGARSTMSYFNVPEPGTELDFYRIDAPIAKSGMASILRATDARDGRTVAIKIPHPDMEADPILSDRFKRESDIGERLNHPNVMRVFGGEKHSRIYMVMEWCPGRLLRQILDEGRLPQDRAIRIAIRNSQGSRLHPLERGCSSRPET